MSTTRSLRFIGALGALGALTILLSAASAAAAVLPAVGVLRTAAGGPVADGDYVLVVRLYDALEAEVPVWEHIILDAAVSDGYFALMIGEAKPIPDALLESGQPLWLQVQVASDPPFPRTPLRDVARAYYAAAAGKGLFPYAASTEPGGSATGLDCSGCLVGGHIAAGTIESKHVSFTYAASDSKDGPALNALEADHALAADEAKHADLADSAKVADSATTAEEALVAGKAMKLDCTGCVTAAMLAPDMQGAWVPAAGGTFAGALTVDAALSVKGATTFAADVDHGWHPSLQFRVQNAAKPPAGCDAAHAGGMYFDTELSALRLCNGQTWLVATAFNPIGTQGAPAKSCAAILSADPTSKTGNWWIDPVAADPKDAFEVACDMETEGGGWIRVQLGSSQNVLMGEESDSNPWRKCGDDSGKHIEGAAEAGVVADFSGTAEHEATPSYLNPATGKPFTAAQLTALRGLVTELGNDTRQVASVADDDAGDWENSQSGGHEVYVQGSDAAWKLLSPGENGECGGGSGWPNVGSQAAHWLWHSTEAGSASDGQFASGPGAIDGLPKTHLLPVKVRLVVATGGGVAWGFEKKIARLR